MPSDCAQKEYTVYRHTNMANGKVYIGITSTDITRRSGSNGKNYKKNTLFYRAIQKYGWDAFSHEVLFSGLSLEDAAKHEVDLIDVYHSNDPRFGYNISTGGEGGNSGVSCSEEERERRRKLMTGENNPCYGRYGENHPAFGRKHSDESKLAVSAALSGRTFSDETLKRMSDARKSMGSWVGVDNPMSGKTYGDAPHARKIVCVETGEMFDSVKRAAEFANVFATSIVATCKGRQKTCGGYHWKYYSSEEVLPIATKN